MLYPWTYNRQDEITFHSMVDSIHDSPFTFHTPSQWPTCHKFNCCTQVSSLHKDVMTALDLSSTEYEVEAIVGIYSVDIALPDYKVAIEVDGPMHFTRTQPRHPLGPTLMKQRHLEGAGWVVVSVSSDDWDAQESRQQKMYLLRDLFYNIEKQQLEAGA